MLTALSDDLQKYLVARYPGAVISDLQFITSGWESDIYTFTLHPLSLAKPSEPGRHPVAHAGCQAPPHESYYQHLITLMEVV